MQIVSTIITSIDDIVSGTARSDILMDTDHTTPQPQPLTLREMVEAITDDLPHDRQPPRTLDEASDLLADYFVHGGDGNDTDRYNETMGTPAGWRTERDARHLALAWHSKGTGHEGARGEGQPRVIHTMILAEGSGTPAERMLEGSKIEHDSTGRFARTRLHKDAMQLMVAEVIQRAEGAYCDHRVAGSVGIVGGLGGSSTEGWVEVAGCQPAPDREDD